MVTDAYPSIYTCWSSVLTLYPHITLAVGPTNKADVTWQESRLSSLENFSTIAFADFSISSMPLFWEVVASKRKNRSTGSPTAHPGAFSAVNVNAGLNPMFPFFSLPYLHVFLSIPSLTADTTLRTNWSYAPPRTTFLSALSPTSFVSTMGFTLPRTLPVESTMGFPSSSLYANPSTMVFDQSSLTHSQTLPSMSYN